MKCVYSGKTHDVACSGFVTVTSRQPNDTLWQATKAMPGKQVSRIGDCKAPGLIAHAVYEGRRYAEEFGEPTVTERRERVMVA